MLYLIWSNDHRGWGKPNRHGYTTLTHRAGQFSLKIELDLADPD